VGEWHIGFIVLVERENVASDLKHIWSVYCYCDLLNAVAYNLVLQQGNYGGLYNCLICIFFKTGSICVQLACLPVLKRKDCMLSAVCLRRVTVLGIGFVLLLTAVLDAFLKSVYIPLIIVILFGCVFTSFYFDIDMLGSCHLQIPVLPIY